MQPAAVPLTELLERLVFILNALLSVLGLTIAEDVLAGLLKPHDQRAPEGADKSFGTDPATAPRVRVPAGGEHWRTGGAAPERGAAEPGCGIRAEPSSAAVIPPVLRRWPGLESPAVAGQASPTRGQGRRAKHLAGRDGRLALVSLR